MTATLAPVKRHVAEEPDVEAGVGDAQFDQDEDHDEDRAAGQRAEDGRIGPVVAVAALDDAPDDGEEAGGGEHHAQRVELLPHLGDRAGQEDERAGPAQHHDRHVDQEDRRPTRSGRAARR